MSRLLCPSRDEGRGREHEVFGACFAEYLDESTHFRSTWNLKIWTKDELRSDNFIEIFCHPILLPSRLSYLI